jgi:peptide/nickel transport system permease protein
MGETTVGGSSTALQDDKRQRQRSWFPRRWRNPVGMIGAAIILLTVLTALFAPILAPYSPSDQSSPRLTAPSREHLMGTDELGRDTFSRVVFGSRVSLQVGMVAVAVALLIGMAGGIAAGFYGGTIDSIIMRFVDLLFAFPGLVLAIVIAGLLGPSRNNAMLAIGIMFAPAFARVVRGAVLSILNEPYVESGRVIGATDFWLVRRYILPNIMAPVIVITTVYFSVAVLAEAALSFLGLGTQPPEPAWGGMLNQARVYMELAPWLAIFPGLAIMLVVMGFNFLGDGLRDILDPRLRER